MPTYDYEHTEKTCDIGRCFEFVQSMASDKLTICPACGEPVRRLISRVNISTPKGNSDLKNMGFTKLVRRDNGVYENVTATGNESRYFDASKPGSAPDLARKIRD